MLPPESQYISQNKNYSHANQDVLAKIDTIVNFNNYDKWSYNSQTQTFQFTPDGFVDMIYIIYRDPDKSWFGNFTAIANLTTSTRPFDFVTNEGKIIRARYLPTRESTGITVRQGLRGHYDLLGISAHEFGHYIFGTVHWNYSGIMGGGTYAMSGWERERVGYIAYTDVTQNDFTKTLGDFIKDGDILRIPITSQNYFLVENHQRQSSYDQIMRGGAIGGAYNFNTTLGSGIYIWRVTNGTSGSPSFEIVTADGRFNWVYDGDFYAPGFHHLTNCPNYVPKTKRTAVSRHTGKNDRMPLHIDWCNIIASKWCDVNEYGNYWLSRDVMGDETDAFNLGYNVIFSPWSNPSSHFGGTTNISLQVFSKNGNNITVKAFTTSASAQNLPPSKPQFLKVQAGKNNRPYLTWDANIEPDILRYDVWKKKFINGSWQWSFLASTTNTNYLDVTEVFCGPPPVPCENQAYVYYKILAVDTQLLQSVFSDPVIAAVQGSPPDKISVDPPSSERPRENSLMQNYPNPFNPATTISYSIPTNGFVTLKVYDILGKEVAELVNEAKEAGNYSVTFNASELPSGIYFYTITSRNFKATKKLILLK